MVKLSLGILIALLMVATTAHAAVNQGYHQQAVQEEELHQQPTREFVDDLTEIPGVEVLTDENIELEGIPDWFNRWSFYYITGMYEDVDGENRLVGIWFNMWNRFEEETHTADWEPGCIALNFIDDEYYCKPDWFLRTSWHGSPGIMGYAIGYRFDPDVHKLSYIHVFAEYYEDEELIRYVDRTLTENWSGGSQNPV